MAENPSIPDFKQNFTKRPLGDVPMTKGTGAKTASYAKGGPVLQQGRSMFMKQPDQFRTDDERQDYGGGKDPLVNREGDGKILKPIKPRT